MKKKLLVVVLSNCVSDLLTYQKRIVEIWHNAGFDIAVICNNGLNEENRLFFEERCTFIIVTDKKMRSFMAWKKFFTSYDTPILDERYSSIICIDDSIIGPLADDASFLETMNLGAIVAAGKISFDDEDKYDAYIFGEKITMDPCFIEMWKNLSGTVSDFTAYVEQFFTFRGLSVQTLIIPSFGINESTLGNYNQINNISFNNEKREGVQTALKLASASSESAKGWILELLRKRYSPELVMQMKGDFFEIRSHGEKIDVKRAAVLIWINTVKQFEELDMWINQTAALDRVFVVDENNTELAEYLDVVNDNRFNVILTDKTALFNVLFENIDIIESYEMIGFYDFTQSGEVLDYLENMAYDEEYIGEVLNCFQKNPEIGILATSSSFYGEEFSSFLSSRVKYKDSQKEWRDRFGLSKKTDVEMPTIDYRFFWIRGKVISCLVNSFTEYDIIVQEKELAQTEWIILPELVQTMSMDMGLIKNSKELLREYWDSLQMTGLFIKKTKNNDNKNERTIQDYSKEIKKTRIVEKTQIEYQDRLIPIGLKEAFIFYMKKKLAGVKRAFKVF